MKLNFSFYFVQFLCGLIVLLSLLPLLGVGDNNLFDGELFDSCFEEEGQAFLQVLLCFFVSYGLGCIVESLSLRNYRFLKLTDRICSFSKTFSLEDDFIFAKSATLLKNEENRGLGDWDVYNLMNAFVLLKSDNLSRMIRNRANQCSVLYSVLIGCILLFINVLLGILGFWEEDYGLAVFLVLFLVFVVLIVFFYRLYKRMLLNFYMSIENAYCILREYKETVKGRTEDEMLVEVEV